MHTHAHKSRPKTVSEMTGFRSHLLLAFVLGEVRELLEGIELSMLDQRLSRIKWPTLVLTHFTH